MNGCYIVRNARALESCYKEYTQGREMNTHSEFVEVLLRRTIEACIGPSALRNQGSAKVLEKAREYLRTIDLRAFSDIDEPTFKSLLDKHTLKLQHHLPTNAQHWGAARKAMNLFLRDILYNRYLCSSYAFVQNEKWLEVPLDSYVARGIRANFDGDLPKWSGIKNLTPATSDKFQIAAKYIARNRKIVPVHLDVYFWREIAKRGSV
ncbi:MAG: hypothetical protein FVQ80_15815 [Planctomycetes bacterium]|nr:hypothetical protein [Planctomycetota bacterium]